jgi:hypothetical protein
VAHKTGDLLRGSIQGKNDLLIQVTGFVTHKFLFTFQVQVWLYSSSICKLNVRVKPVLRRHLWDKEKMVF